METTFKYKLTPHASVFFPKRNGIKPEVQLNRNYTEEVLHYMSKPWAAELVANDMEDYLKGQKCFIIEICAGIGGNTLEFLSRKSVSTVMSFEQDQQRAIMLQRNIMAYNFGNKAIVKNMDVSGNEKFEDFEDAVFFFDPPWLPNDLVKAGEDYRDFYITKNMKVGELFLEQWLEKLRSTAYMVIFRLPPGSELQNVPGWTYVVYNVEKPGRKSTGNVVDIPGKNGKMFVCINNRRIKGSDVTVFGGYSKKEDVISKLLPISLKLTTLYDSVINKCSRMLPAMAKKDNDCIQFVKYSFDDTQSPKPEEKLAPRDDSLEESDTGTWFSSKNFYFYKDVPKPSKSIDMNSPEYVSELSEYIRWCLQRFVKNDDIVNGLISGDNIQTWLRAFTSEEINPDNTMNYESLETVGDKAINYCMCNYIFNKFGGKITAEDITKYIVATMSKEFQSAVSRNTFHFREWLITGSKKSKTIDEDLFEAFCGALHQTGDDYAESKGGSGLGIQLCKKFLNYIMSKIELTEVALDKAAPSQLINQGFEQIGFKKTDYTILKPLIGNRKVASFVINNSELIRYFNRNNINIPGDGVIYKAVFEKDKADKAINAEMYSKAYKELKRLGFTPEFITKMREERSLDKFSKMPNGDKIIKIFKNKLEREDYVATDFNDITGVGGSGKTQLIGIDREGNRKILTEIINIDPDRDTNRFEAIRNYVGL